MAPEPEPPKSSDTIVLRPSAFKDHASQKLSAPEPEARPVQPEPAAKAEPFDKVAALKEMEPVGYTAPYEEQKQEKAVAAPQQPVHPVESPEKKAMEETRVMKPVKPQNHTETAHQEAPKAAPVKPEEKVQKQEPVKPAAAMAAKAAEEPKPAAAPKAAATANAAAPAATGKKHGSPKQALKKMEKALNKENVEEALTDSKAKMGGILDRIRKFIDDNLYETVPEDEAGEEYGATSAEDSKAPAFSFKVFTTVFVVCLAIFTVVMAYFVFGGKTTQDLKATDSITDGVKSDHSSEKKAEPEKKEAEKPKEEAKGDDKTLGKGNGVTVVVTYKKPVWTQTTIDGKQVEAATVAKGSTRTYKGSKSVSVNVGSIRDVTITVNGKEVPYGSKEWGVVTRTFKAK